MLYKSVGTLRYDIGGLGNYRLVLEADQELANYYRSLIPKYKYARPQRYSAHVSVVRHEVPVNLDVWGNHDGEEVIFVYDNEIKCGKVYYWVNVFSIRLEEVRRELGLPVSSEYTRPPDGFMKCFHMTLANTKNI